jgi:transcriptional regulator with XRE-family HTH domain
MPGRGTEPGPELYDECGTHEGVLRHRREGTRMCARDREVQRVAMHRYRVSRIVGGRRLVSTLGLRRRVHALARRGWAQADIAERLGMSRQGFAKIVCQDETSRDIVDKVRGIYPELAWREGPNLLARKYAEKRGLPGPMDWEDIDDPREVPECWSVENALLRAKEACHEEALELHRAFLVRERERARAQRKNETRRAMRQADRRSQQLEAMTA